MEPLKGIKILVVEDHDDSREILEQSLEFYGGKVTVAASALQALDSIADVDVIVTDFSMPERDGIWLLEQVAQRSPLVPVILLSGFSALQIEAIARAPFTLKLLKPVDSSELSRAILDVLARA
jgi:CheY-like chemotaxis protein